MFSLQIKQHLSLISSPVTQVGNLGNVHQIRLRLWSILGASDFRDITTSTILRFATFTSSNLSSNRSFTA
ncbi:hypothetical protein AFLA_007101 [Aspergillus flavus NRRL3357]|nr:hypothetical protein AFLA_007101 [Aspergillus flavus NRRL3357]